jgi:hypothetical protein
MEQDADASKTVRFTTLLVHYVGPIYHTTIEIFRDKAATFSAGAF